MPNLATMEINEIRPFFTLAHKRLVTLDPDNERRAELEELWMEKEGETLRRAERGEFDQEEMEY